MTRILTFCLLSLSIVSARADPEVEKVGGPSAVKLWDALSAVYPKQKTKIEFSGVECAFKAPDDQDECHTCLAHRDKKGNACKICEELEATTSEKCTVNGKKEIAGKEAKKLGAALRKVPTASQVAGGTRTLTIEGGDCKKGPPPFCRYSFEKTSE